MHRVCFFIAPCMGCQVGNSMPGFVCLSSRILVSKNKVSSDTDFSI